MGQKSHPTGHATLLKYLETPTGLVGKATRRGRQTEGSVRGRCRGGSVNLKYGETEQPLNKNLLLILKRGKSCRELQHLEPNHA